MVTTSQSPLARCAVTAGQPRGPWSYSPTAIQSTPTDAQVLDEPAGLKKNNCPPVTLVLIARTSHCAVDPDPEVMFAHTDGVALNANG